VNFARHQKLSKSGFKPLFDVTVSYGELRTGNRKLDEFMLLRVFGVGILASKVFSEECSRGLGNAGNPVFYGSIRIVRGGHGSYNHDESHRRLMKYWSISLKDVKSLLGDDFQTEPIENRHERRIGLNSGPNRRS
jgi:hypothetical protein